MSVDYTCRKESRNSKIVQTLTINTRSLLHKINDLRTIVLISSPLIIFVTESWLNNSILDDEIALENYICFRKDRSEGNGGGVMLYIHASLNAHPLDLTEFPSLEVVGAILCISNDTKLLVATVYRPPNMKINTDSSLHNLFKQFSENQAKIKIISGDFNLPDIDWVKQTFPRYLDLFISALQQGDWQQHVTTPTRGKNILDLIFTNGITHTCIKVGDHFPQSDHKLLQMEFSLNTENKQLCQSLAPFRNWSEFDTSTALSYIQSCNWNIFLNTSHLDECLVEFYLHINNCLDTLAPLTPNTLKSEHSNSFIPLSIRRKLRCLRKVFHSNNDVSALIQIKGLLQQCETLRRDKLRTQEVTANESCNKAHALARLYKKRTSSKDVITSLEDEKNKTIIEHPSDICKALNEFFSSCYNIENTQIDYKQTSHTSLLAISNINFTIPNIIKSINTLRNSKGLGPDGIPPLLIKTTATYIAPILLKIFDISFNSMHYPNEWSTSYIRPKFKSGSKLSIKNYRPINVTPVLSRVMERIIKEQMTSFFISNNIITNAQHGFRPKRSCTTCQIEFLDRVTSLRDEGYSVAILYFDFSKAFDVVSHNRLLYKLQTLGIKDPLYTWILSFLTNRYQVTNIGSYYSEPRPITSGVIQGSVLGPLLFLLYVNDITGAIKHGRSYLYADDLKVVYKIEKHNVHSNTLDIQKDLKELDTWCERWAMKLNVNKCGVMLIGDQTIDSTLTLNSCPLNTINFVKDLGITYNNKLSFSRHVTTMTACANRRIGFIHRNFELAESKKLLYKMFVRPKLEYCSFIYTLANKTEKDNVERVQRGLTRRIIGSKTRPSYIVRCQNLDLEPIWLRRLKHNLIILFKLMHDTNDLDLEIKFQPQSHYSLRNNSHRLHQQKPKRLLKQRSFIIRYSNLWNCLPEYIRQSNSIGILKNNLNSYFNLTDLITSKCLLTTFSDV